ncbi:MAG: diacylglycerol kinase family lipid kinase [Actinobacteria bacterium]|nr:diacylglycerol kinase family lipid kinase [Actinomycetota bacterium]
MSRAFRVIVNPASGRGKTRKLLPRIESALKESGVEAEVCLSESPAHPPELAKEAFDQGRTVVACGGDGLVGQLAGVAADCGGTLGLIPTGSGNDFARNVGFDHKDPFAAIDVLSSGQVRAIDLGRVDGQWFCCVASTGFDAEANRWANTVHRLRGTALYVAATFRTLAIYHPKRFVLTVDGIEHEIEGWLLAVGNATSYGGGMKVVPMARLDDGLLHGTAVGRVSKFEFVRTFPRVFKGTHVDHPKVQTFEGRTFELASADGEPLPVFADGEHVADLPVSISVVPGALSLFAPA